LAAEPRPEAASAHSDNPSQNERASHPALSGPLVTIINPPSAPLQGAPAQGSESHDKPDKPFWLDWEFWTAIGTLALGGVTLWLVRKTDGLIRSAEKSSERQLRAYLSVAGMTFVEQNPQGAKFEVKTVIKNFGQTPAHDVRFRGRVEVLATNVIQNFDFNLIEIGTPEGAFVGPTQEKFYSNILDRNLTQAEIADLLNPAGAHKLIIWGTVWYKDAFGRSRHTNFCRVALWITAGTQPNWLDMTRYNDAD
jgi:hypothetical protein